MNLSCSPGCGVKSVRCVSTRPDVQLPAPSLMALMASLPVPSRETLAVEALMVSTSPVPQFAAPPGYWVPVRRSQFAPEGEVPAAPSKSSFQTSVQLPGGGVGVTVGVGEGLVPPMVP